MCFNIWLTGFHFALFESKHFTLFASDFLATFLICFHEEEHISNFLVLVDLAPNIYV